MQVGVCPSSMNLCYCYCAMRKIRDVEINVEIS